VRATLTGEGQTAPITECFRLIHCHFGVDKRAGRPTVLRKLLAGVCDAADADFRFIAG
jgi:hypothetical protein